MTNEEIRKELKKYNIQDNPFDTMMHMAIELSRFILFSCVRLNNPNVPSQIQPGKELLDYYITNISETFDSLLEMNDEAVDVCKHTSYYYTNWDKFNKLNDQLNKARNAMETIYSRCVPNRNDEFEKIRLGENSPEYQRLLELRKIADTTDKNSGFWHNLVDILERPKECIEYGWNTEAEVKDREKFIKNYNLTVDNIKYIIAYKYKK